MLDDLTALGPFFAVSSHPPGAAPVPPWRPQRLAGPSGPLSDRIASVRAALAARGGRPVAEVEPRVAASAVHLGLVARLVSPALGAAVLGYHVDLRPDGLWWQDTAGGPVPLSVPAGDAANPGEWDRPLLDEAVAPLTAAVARLVPVSGRVLWGNVAAAANAAAAQVARRRPDLAGDAWRAPAACSPARGCAMSRTRPARRSAGQAAACSTGSRRATRPRSAATASSPGARQTMNDYPERLRAPPARTRCLPGPGERSVRCPHPVDVRLVSS